MKNSFLLILVITILLQACGLDDEVKRSNENLTRSTETLKAAEESSSQNIQEVSEILDFFKDPLISLAQSGEKISSFLDKLNSCYDLAIDPRIYQPGRPVPKDLQSLLDEVDEDILLNPELQYFSRSGEVEYQIIPREYKDRFPRKMLIPVVRPYSDCDTLMNGLSYATESKIDKLVNTFGGFLDEAFGTSVGKFPATLDYKIDCQSYLEKNRLFQELLYGSGNGKAALLRNLLSGNQVKKYNDRLEAIAGQSLEEFPCQTKSALPLLQPEKDIQTILDLNIAWVEFVNSWNQLQSDYSEEGLRVVNRERLDNLEFPRFSHPLVTKYYRPNPSSKREMYEKAFLQFFSQKNLLKGLANASVQEIPGKLTNLAKLIENFKGIKFTIAEEEDGLENRFRFDGLREEQSAIIKDVATMVYKIVDNGRASNQQLKLLSEMLTRAIFVLWEYQLNERYLFGQIQGEWDSSWDKEKILSLDGIEDVDQNLLNLNSAEEQQVQEKILVLSTFQKKFHKNALAVLEEFFQQMTTFSNEKRGVRKESQVLPFFHADSLLDPYDYFFPNEQHKESEKFKKIWNGFARKAGRLSKKINFLPSHIRELYQLKNWMRSNLQSALEVDEKKFPNCYLVSQFLKSESPQTLGLTDFLIFDEKVLRHNVEQQDSVSFFRRFLMMSVDQLFSSFQRKVFHDLEKSRDLNSARLSVLTLNTYLLYLDLLASSDVAERAKQIGKELAEVHPDVIILQEVFPPDVMGPQGQIIWPDIAQWPSQDFFILRQALQTSPKRYPHAFVEKQLAGELYQNASDIARKLLKGKDLRQVWPKSPSSLPTNLGPSGQAIFVTDSVLGRNRGKKKKWDLDQLGSHFHFIKGRHYSEKLIFPLAGGALRGLFSLEGLGVFDVNSTHLSTENFNSHMRSFQVASLINMVNQTSNHPLHYAREEKNRLELFQINAGNKQGGASENFEQFTTNSQGFFLALENGVRPDFTLLGGDFNEGVFGNRTLLPFERRRSSWPLGLIFSHSNFSLAGPFLGQKDWATYALKSSSKPSSFQEIISAKTQALPEKTQKQVRSFLFGEQRVERFGLPQKIDYILYSQRAGSKLLVTPLKQKILFENLELSDHAAVFVEFGLLKPLN